MICFCTAIYNRLWQIKETLPHNLSVLKGKGGGLFLLDYGSDDGLEEWLKSTSLQEFNEVLFYKKIDPNKKRESFNASHAKNLAHEMALEKYPDGILFNLDADNFINEELTHLTRIFKMNPSAIIHNWSGSYKDGTYGRVAIKGRFFKYLGGYDECYQGLMYQDSDLISRAVGINLEYILLPYSGKLPIKNTLKEKFKNIQNFESVIENNRQHYLENYKKGIVQVNTERGFAENLKITEYSPFRLKRIWMYLKDITVSWLLGFSHILGQARVVIGRFIMKLYWIFIYQFFWTFIYKVYWITIYKLYRVILHKVIYRAIRIVKRIIGLGRNPVDGPF